MSLYEQLIQEGLEKGLEQGLEQGREQGLLKAVKAMLNLHMSVATIAAALELPVAQVQVLETKINETDN
ncbi:hypothetical protein [Fibrella arboris]|uniref:hypothetical protein n=1 Tax=Fibrella arboris TaxID=3242486 RepID=UPI00351F9C9F